MTKACSRRNVAVAVVASVFVAGCLSEPGDDALPVFGDSYQIATKRLVPEPPHLVPAPPVVDGDRLIVQLKYGGRPREGMERGGNEPFDLAWRAVALRDVEVWLYKPSSSGPDLVLYQETREFHLPPAVETSRRVTLLAPDGEKYVLR